ncbi:MAG: CheR family methyltransferase [Armatimonadota bacterium]
MQPDLLCAARRVVEERLGLDFRVERGEALQRRLSRALRETAREDLESALARLMEAPSEDPELMALARGLTVGETYFFRDRACFEALERHVLPPLLAARRAAGSLHLRVWSAGCSTGEEPYSLAILLDRLLPDFEDWRVTLLATDINPDSLERAREGRYGEWSFRTTPRWVRERYFHRVSGRTYELDARIRKRVSFRALNLAEVGYPSAASNTLAMDLVLCRNVLMYFTEDARAAALERLRQALTPGGWLVVASPEASGSPLAPLLPVNFPGATLYQKQEPAAQPPLRKGASLPPGEAVAAAGAPSYPASRRLPASPLLPATPARGVEEPHPLVAARRLANAGQLQEARAICESVTAEAPLLVEGWVLLATVCDESGDAEAAQRALRRALYLDPDCAFARLSLGLLLFRSGDRGRGLRQVEHAARQLEGLSDRALVEHADGATAGELLTRALRLLEIGSRRAA